MKTAPLSLMSNTVKLKMRFLNENCSVKSHVKYSKVKNEIIEWKLLS